jgi:hypothetical protein
LKYAAITGRRRCEPAFDVPPRFAGRDDRRLAERAAAILVELRSGSALPDADRFATAIAAEADFCTHGVGLDFDPAIAVREIGAAVAATFGRALDGGPTPLGTVLTNICEGLRSNPVPVRFEHGFERNAGRTTIVLARGVVLPLGQRGIIARAHAVLTWTEILAPVATERLYRELSAAIGAGPPCDAQILPFPRVRR